MKFAQLISALFCFFLINANAQEQLGIRLDNYAGINGVLLNPAHHLTTPFSWDVNLVEGAQFFDNNYAFLRQTKLTDLLRHGGNSKFLSAPDVDDDNKVPDGTFVVDYYNDGRPRYANALTSITGPSFFVRINENHALGLVTRARFIANGRGVSDNLSYYVYNDRPFFEDFSVDAFNLGAMSWSEVGLNYLYSKETNNGRLGLGVTAKFLQGYEAAYFQSEDDFFLTKLPNDSLSSSPITVNFGYTNTNLGDDFQLQQNGAGVGFDLGLVYAIGDEEEGYRWKVGFSLMDIGFIRFNQAEQHQIVTDDARALLTTDYAGFGGLSDLPTTAETFSEQLLGDPNASFQGEGFSMFLPAAFSLQVEHSFNSAFFVNAAVVQGFKMGQLATTRGSLIALSPRFETRWFGASVPVSLYNFQDINVGLAFRLGFITLGTDNLMSIINAGEFTGTDGYFAIKINPFGIGKSDKGPFSSGFKGRSKAGKNKVKCYSF